MSHKYPVTFFTEIHPSSSLHLCPCPAHRTSCVVSLPGEHFPDPNPVPQCPCPGAGRLPLTILLLPRTLFEPLVPAALHPTPSVAPLDLKIPSPLHSQV